MRVSKPRNRAALAVLALAVVAVFLLPASTASAGTATVSNACANNVSATRTQTDVTTVGADAVGTAAPGQALTLSGLSQSGTLPGNLFVAGYNLGLLQAGANSIPANVQTKIEATNTVQGTQTTNVAGGSPPDGSVTLTTTITDPDGVPGTGDETATDPSFGVSYDDLNWTAGPGGTIGYRQDSIATPPPTASNNTLLINFPLAGVINIQFRCAPGTVLGPEPGTITLIDPAPPFDITGISAGPLSASAGADQSVASGALVTLDGSGSTGVAPTYSWSQLSGPTVTLSDPSAVMPTFTAPAGPATLEFQLEVCDPAPLCAADTVVITVIESRISIDDVVVTEGDSGTTPATFTVSLSSASAQTVTVDFATADDTATAPGDYVSASGTVTFAPGDTAEAVTVLVNGDTQTEPNETFFVNLSNQSANAAISDGQGQGLILDDDANLPPAADAGPDQTVNGGDLVTLDGTGSYDPEGQPLTYSWTQLFGPAVTLSDPSSATPTFTAPTGPATLLFELEVCDPAPLCATADVVITVNPPPPPPGTPTANAGPDQTVSGGDLVTLDGTASSDPDGEALTYSWSQLSGPAVTLSDPTSATPTFTMPAEAVALNFQLEVCDPGGLCDTDTVVISQLLTGPPVPNACTNSATANLSQIDVSTSGSDGVAFATPGQALTLNGIIQSAVIPGDILVAGYNLGLLTQGLNNIPANVQTKIEATNTTQGTQTTNTVGGTPPNGSVTVTTTITDPDGIPGTGDESATDALFTVAYNNLNWTAGASGTIDYRQESIATAPPTAANNTLLINTLLGGIIGVQFRCAPGTVDAATNTITLIDPAPSFDTTNLFVVDHPPTANAGPDQTVFSGDLVTLDGTGSTDPEGDPLTYSWTQTSGPTVTLSDPTSATPTFTAPTGPATLTFELQVCDPLPLCNTDSVVITVLHSDVDAAGEVIVSGPVKAGDTRKAYVFRVSNLGLSPITIDCATEISAQVLVNGVPNGVVRCLTATKTLSPGGSVRFRLRWNGDPLPAGATVEFIACVNEAGDIDPSNDCGSVTRTT